MSDSVGGLFRKKQELLLNRSGLHSRNVHEEGIGRICIFEGKWMDGQSVEAIFVSCSGMTRSESKNVRFD
jgi:hypothetical protein